jgi:hypothetical protein
MRLGIEVGYPRRRPHQTTRRRGLTAWTARLPNYPLIVGMVTFDAKVDTLANAGSRN